jgi:hypothetical protein
MVNIKVLMNSNIEEVLAFKCCSLPDQNLEIHVSNSSNKAVNIKNYFLLKNDFETIKVENIYPPRCQTVEPNDIAAFYCSMDDKMFQRYHTLTLFDTDGNSYSAKI